MDKMAPSIISELILMAPHMCALNKYYYNLCKEVFKNPTLMERTYVPGQHQMPTFSVVHGLKIDESLCVAAKHGHVEVVKALLKAGADVDAWAGGAVVCAARHAHVEVLDVLLQAGADCRSRKRALGVAERMRDAQIELGDDTIAFDKIIQTLEGV
ncbi:Ankyrin repeat domain-containing protein [Tetrabaena socialis]|uniref:Ankyrin repeat domain-containing protein n=1 Tax=Tetrabaena socialis TaxID=47790 RepID=A0A2J7ZHC2_9CHLO|nr:Ankyrin repeat domain-containing protein [Tetrabaena socialis]|eukprot:PNG99647.1 Ankyrin repeat domain-containing protein [Tetrabaena socialis]